jgi:hypothetical protein
MDLPFLMTATRRRGESVSSTPESKNRDLECHVSVRLYDMLSIISGTGVAIYKAVVVV